MFKGKSLIEIQKTPEKETPENSTERQVNYSPMKLSPKEVVADQMGSWYTGIHPTECRGFDQQEQVLRSMAMPRADKFTREDLLAYFDNTWTLTEILFSGLYEESFYRPPYHNLRHPLIFYYAHPAALYINKFRVAGLITEPVNQIYEAIFETGVDEMSWDDMSKNEMEWPTIQDAREFKIKVYKIVKDVILKHPELEESRISQSSKNWAVLLGFEHERIHIETTSVLIRELPSYLVKKPRYWVDNYPLSSSENTQQTENIHLVEFTEKQKVVLGKPENFPSFGWDNEYGRREFEIDEFRISDKLITNGQFWHFLKDNGYAEKKYWTEDGWGWRSFRNLKWPTFWVRDGPQGLHQYKLRTIFEIIDMQWDWPVIVNYYEAKAYCNWLAEKRNLPRGEIRLATELEHHAIRDVRYRTHELDENLEAYGETLDDLTLMHDGASMKNTIKVNAQLAFGSESSVNFNPANSKGIHDVFGNVWEWCEGFASALPGFKIHPVYEDFSLPCFDGKHSMIMGGSFISTGDELSKFARFYFRPHFFQHAGFRVVQASVCQTSDMDAPGPFNGKGPWASLNPEIHAKLTSKDLTYETDRYVWEFIAYHYGQLLQEYAPFKNFPQQMLDFNVRIALECTSLIGQTQKPMRALDLGCAVGRAVFELSRRFDEVIGIDISQSFINVAKEIKEEGQISYRMFQEGDTFEDRVASLDPTIERSKCSFRIGDMCNLPIDLGQFDLVLIANVLCRVAYPKTVLQRLCGAQGLVKEGGFVVIASPFSWEEKYTAKCNWLGGQGSGKCKKTSKEALHEIMQEDFTLLKEDDIPFIIREHQRKFQLVYSYLTVYQKKVKIQSQQ